MSGTIPPAQIQLLKVFVQACKSSPNILHEPELAFFKSWLEELGADIPPAREQPKPEVMSTTCSCSTRLGILNFTRFLQENRWWTCQKQHLAIQEFLCLYVQQLSMTSRLPFLRYQSWLLKVIIFIRKPLLKVWLVVVRWAIFLCFQRKDRKIVTMVAKNWVAAFLLSLWG